MTRLTPSGLSLLWPTPHETELLRACLWSGPAACQAWQRWQQDAGSVAAALRAPTVKPLLALLHHSARSHGLPVEPPVRAALAAAALAERLRLDAYHRICARACAALEAASVPFLVVAGAALGDTVYPEPSLRHSHDVDLLVSPDDLARAAGALRGAGFAPVPAPDDDEAARRQLRDDSGLPVALHGHLFPVRFYDVPMDAVRSRTLAGTIAGRRVPTLSPADHLLHVCGLASCAGHGRSLKWVCDAWYIVARHPELDAQSFLQTAEASRLALPLSVVLRYLAEALEAPLAGQLLAGLRASAAHTDRVAREVALFGIRASGRGRIRHLVRATRGWRDGVELARWIVAPSRTSLRLGARRRRPRSVIAGYLLRPWASLRRLATWRGGVSP